MTKTSLMLTAVGIFGLATLPNAANSAAVALPGATLSELVAAPDTDPITTEDGIIADTGLVPQSYPGAISFNVTLNTPNGTTNTPTSTSGAITVGGGGNFSTVTPSATPAPSLSATTFVLPSPGNDFNGGTSEGDLRYYFKAVSSTGALGETTIRVQATGAVSVQTGASDIQQTGTASATLLIDLGSIADDAASAVFTDTVLPDSSFLAFDSSSHTGAGFISPGGIIDQAGSSLSGGFNESGIYTITYGQGYSVQLDVIAKCTSSGGCTSSASIDPIFTPLDPNTSLIFSPGIGNGNVNPVPEPSTWAMMLAGFAGVGLCLRRQFRTRARSA